MKIRSQASHTRHLACLLSACLALSAGPTPPTAPLTSSPAASPAPASAPAIAPVSATAPLPAQAPSLPPASQRQLDTPYLLVVSIDGYRHDYTTRFDPVNIGNFVHNKARMARSLIPIFPSMTFPNHYSIATGLYAEHTGMIANEFLNPQTNTTFSIYNPATSNDGAWYGGTPIWVLAEQQGLRSASYFWPGSSASIQGVRPSFYFNYDARVTNHERVDQVIRWLQLPVGLRPHLISLYFSDVDTAGHLYGPDSKETAEAVRAVDHEIGYLLRELGRLPPLPLNLLIVSDHGMQAVDESKAIYLADLIKLGPGIQVKDDGAFAMIYVADPKERLSIYKTLRAHPKLNVYLREQMPEHLHFKDHPMIADIIVSPIAPEFVLIDRQIPRRRVLSGDHGYDPTTTKNMHGIFYAYGPNIQPGPPLPSFENIEVYPLMARILNLTLPAKLDAKPDIANLLYRR